jgi:hypothetical protein
MIFGQRVLIAPGDWSLTLRALRRPRFARVHERFPEGTVTRFWLAWLFVKVRVRA